jgi:hypothetical protein
VAGLIFTDYLFVIQAPQQGTVGADAHAYWQVDPVHPYLLQEGATGAFLYPPVVGRLFGLFRELSWPTFWFLWSALLVGSLVWLGWRRALLLLAFPPIALDLYFGNMNLLIAAAIALGFRYPWAWAFVLLTKITPGVGLIWFAARREWRSLITTFAITAFIVTASVALDARLWQEWLAAIKGGSGPVPAGVLPIPLVFRLLAAALLVFWGARTSRRWTVPVAATLALPVLWIGGFAVLAALAAINRRDLEPSGFSDVQAATEGAYE